MVDRSTVDETVFDWKVDDATTTNDTRFTFRARPELGRFPIHLNKEEWVDFVELTLADWLEQVQGAAETPSAVFHWREAGEAYAYRRTAYAKMAEILSHERPDRLKTVVKETHAGVYGTEGSATRHLVQPRTPPPTEAAKSALEALRSAGENIPLSFAPGPIVESAAQDYDTCNQIDEEIMAGLSNVTEEATLDVSENANVNVYETDDLLDMYLGFHYPMSGSRENVSATVEHKYYPKHAKWFMERVVFILKSQHPIPINNRVLDVGCAVGGASFELASVYRHVEAFDSSEKFIAAAKHLQSGRELRFKVPIEGDIVEEVSVVHERGFDATTFGRVNFFRGDASDLAEYADSREGFGTFDGVIMANVLCRLPDPVAVLNALPKIVNRGGIVVIVTPFSWLEEFTPRSKWLGGFRDPASEKPIYSKDTLKKIMEGLGFRNIYDQQMPLLIPEHRRKYQYIVSHATAWRKQ